MYTRIFVLPLMLLALAGCAEMSTTARVSETAWQTLNVIDAGQTVMAARRPDHFQESWSRSVLGAHPSESKVYATLGAGAVVHYAITALLDRCDTDGVGGWHTASLMWQGFTLGGKTVGVIYNAEQGVPLWGSRK